MSYLDQSLDAALLSNTTAVNAVATGSDGSGISVDVGVIGSFVGTAGLESAQTDSETSANDAQGLATSNASQGNEALPSGSKPKLSATNLKIYTALAPFDGVELSGSALFSLAEDKKWFTRPETKIFAYLQEVGRCSLEVLKRMTGVRASTLTRVLSFFEHLELIKLSANEVCLLQNQPVDLTQPVVNRDEVKEAKITLDLKAICDRSLKLFNNTVFEALRKFKAINVLDLRAFSGVSPARFLSCCGQLLATGKAVYKAGVLYWAPCGLQVKPRSTRKPLQENQQDDIEPDGTCDGTEVQEHNATATGSALGSQDAIVASSTAANMSAASAERHDIQEKAVIDIDLDEMICLSDRLSPRSISQETSSFVSLFEAEAQEEIGLVKAQFSQEPLEVPALASSFEKSVTPELPLSGSAFPPMVSSAQYTAPDMWLEFATYSGCTLVEPIKRGYNVWDVVQNDDSEPASNTQLRHEPVVANNVPQLSSKTVSDGHGAVGHRDSTCPLDQNADVALVPEVIEEDEELEVAPTDTSACHIGNKAGSVVLAQDPCSEHVEQAQQIEPTILVTQGISAQAAHKIEPKPTHKELSEPVPVPVPERVPPSCAIPSPQIDTSAESVRIEQPCATAQIVPTPVAKPVVPKDSEAGAVGSRKHVNTQQSLSPSLNAHTSLKVAQPNRGQMGGTTPLANALLHLLPQCIHPTCLAPSSFRDAEMRQENKRRKVENYRRAEAFVKKQFLAKSARQQAQPRRVQAQSQVKARPQVQDQQQVQAQPQVQPQPKVQAQPQSQGQAQSHVQVQVQPQSQVPTESVNSGRKLPIDYMRHYVEPELRPDMTKTLEYRVIKMWCYQGEFGSMTPSPELIHMAAQAYGETIGREVTPNDAPAIFELLEELHKRRVEQARQRKAEQAN